MECLRCKGEMESGFVGDAVPGGVRPSVWFSGRPKWSVWGGLKVGGRKQIYVQAMRCVDCGYLESYALESLPSG